MPDLKVLEGESKYKTLVEHIPQKIFVKDRDSVYISCNENYARDLNIKADEIAGKTDYDFFPKELAEKYRADDRRIIESGVTEDIEERYIRDGNETWVHTVKTPFRNKDGNVAGVLGAFRDITERKKADDMMRQHTEHLMAINETAVKLAAVESAAGIYKIACEELKGITGAMFTAATSYDPQKEELKAEKICADNKFINKASEIFGFKLKNFRISVKPQFKAELLSRKAKRLEGLQELVFGEFPRAMTDMLEKALKVGDVYGLTLHYGGEFMGTMAVIMPAGRTALSLEMLKNFANLTAVSLQRKEAEEALRKTHNELELRVKQRTAELERKNLALKELIEYVETEKNKMKSDTAVNVRELLLPILKKLRIKGASPKYIDLLQRHLEDMASPFGRTITEKSIKLTPREIEICNMAKGGLTSKELSRLLNLSPQTIEKHRKNIRKKLGISKKKVNLVTFLQGI